MRRVRRLLLLVPLLAPCVGPAGCDPEPRTAAPAAERPTCRVEKGPFKVEVSLKGVFEAESMAEVALRPEVWTPENRGALTVTRALEQGATVRKGDPVVWLDHEKIDQAIEDQASSCRLAELAVKLAEEELPLLRKSAPLELATAERASRVADEDLKKFLEQDRALSEKTARHSVKEAKDALEYDQEELRQLEKMYRSRDLTEETEQIILRRHRNRVDSARFRLEGVEARSAQTLKVDLPRQEQTLKENAGKQALALEKLRTSQPVTLDQKALALDKLKYDRDRGNDRLARLRRDRALMTVAAPADGIVYYGKCNRGQWTTVAAAAKLQRGGTLTPDEVFMTIVRPRALFARATVDEKDLHAVRAGMDTRVTPAAYPDRRVAGKVETVTAIPVTAGTFEARVSLAQDKLFPELMPGMACTVKVTVYRKDDALTLPAAAVHADDSDDDRHFVYVAAGGGGQEKRAVSVGRRSADRVEILEGLRNGELVLTGKPPDAAGTGGSKKGGQP
jgi:multidrug resistance efflux pump